MEVFTDKERAKNTFLFMKQLSSLPSIAREFDREIEAMIERCWDQIYDLLTEEYSESIGVNRDPMQDVEDEIKKLTEN